MSKKAVWIVCGGVSSEHAISILSARTIARGCDAAGYAPYWIYVDCDQRWFWLTDWQAALTASPASVVAAGQAQQLLWVPGDGWRGVNDPLTPIPCDVVFPIVHGTQGEDGVLQGLLTLMGLPFVGSDVLGSAIGMAKHVTKSLLRDAGVGTAPFCVLTASNQQQHTYAACVEALGSARLVVKPSQQGSSVGVSCVHSAVEWQAAVQLALAYDHVALVEPFVEGREIECSVLGNDTLQVSVPGEVVKAGECYGFDDKYSAGSDAKVVTPAALAPLDVAAVQQVARQAYWALGCAGLARVDLFLQPDGTVWVNEVNTLPGFTDISMYPQNWQVSGMSLAELITELVTLAETRHTQQQALSTRQCDFIHAASITDATQPQQS